MSIRGYYRIWSDPRAALYAPATVRLHRFGVEGQVHFLIDTGADVTCLHPQDTRGLGLPDDLVIPGNILEVSGIGGGVEYYREEATLVFRDEDGSPMIFNCELCISQAPALERLPSLLGRDFLNRCSLLADNPRNEVLITPANVISGIILPG